MTYGRPISDASSAITFASHSLPCHGNDGWYKWANYEGADTCCDLALDERGVVNDPQQI